MSFKSLLFKLQMHSIRKKKLTRNQLLAEKRILAWKRETLTGKFRTIAALTLLFTWSFGAESICFGRISSTTSRLREYLFVTRKRDYYRGLLYPVINGYVTENPTLSKPYKKVIRATVEFPIPHSHHKNTVLLEQLSHVAKDSEAAVVGAYLCGEEGLLSHLERTCCRGAK